MSSGRKIGREDARRVRACLNACEGISTENLEQNRPIKWLAAQYNATLKQRDGLVKALDELVNGRQLDDVPNHDDDSLRSIANRLPEGWARQRLLDHADRVEAALANSAGASK